MTEPLPPLRAADRHQSDASVEVDVPATLTVLCCTDYLTALQVMLIELEEVVLTEKERHEQEETLMQVTRLLGY